MLSPMRTKIAMSFLIALTASSATAADSCQDLFVPRHERRLVIAPESNTPYSHQQHLQFLDQIDSTLGSLAAPTEVPIYIRGSGTFAVYDYFHANEIQTVDAFTKYTAGKSNHPKYSLLILAHEYGHAIFEKNIVAKSPVWNQIRVEYKGLRGKTDEISKRISEISAQMPQAKDPAERESLQAQMKQAFEQVTKHTARINTLMVANRLMGGYHEVFADVIAVLEANDPRAVYKSIIGDVVPRANVDGRDFTNPYGPARWETWLREQKASSSSNVPKDSHTIFAPVRPHIWEFIERSGSRADKAKIIESVFNILMNDFDARITRLEDVDKFDLEEANRSLIEAFRNL